MHTVISTYCAKGSLVENIITDTGEWDTLVTDESSTCKEKQETERERDTKQDLLKNNRVSL